MDTPNTIVETRAAGIMAERAAELNPAQVVQLLFDGCLERLGQARSALAAEDLETGARLLEKAVGIINGLRASLDLQHGGDLAVNLDGLYDYVATRLCAAEADDAVEIILEAEALIGKLKSGWDSLLVERVA